MLGQYANACETTIRGDSSASTSNKQSSASSDASSPYGFLRAPWNLNPSPYVSRYHKNCGEDPSSMYSWPTCMNHWALTFKKKTWYDWIW